MSIRRPKRLALIAAAVALVGGVVWLACALLWPVGRFAEVDPGRLYRCRQPHGLQWRLLGQYHIRTVIDLKTRGEDPETFDDEQRRLAEAGVKLVHIPVDSLLPSYEQFERFLRDTRASDGAVLVHCEHGRNRTGFMVAAYRVVMQGWSVERAMEDFEQYDPWGSEVDDADRAKRAELVVMLQQIHDHREDWLQRTAPDPNRTP